jgi:ubiquinone/menaquinone biosynthesis C-methylase UbiE
VRRFPAPEGLAKLIDEAGFDEISWRLFGGGIVALHKGTAR